MSLRRLLMVLASGLHIDIYEPDPMQGDQHLYEGTVSVARENFPAEKYVVVYASVSSEGILKIMVGDNHFKGAYYEK